MKKVFLFLFAIFLITACEKETVEAEVPVQDVSLEERAVKVGYCVPDGSGGFTYEEVKSPSKKEDDIIAAGGVPAVDNDGDGYADCQGDCDDNNPNIYPKAPDICDGLDNDCDGQFDEDFNCGDVLLMRLPSEATFLPGEADSILMVHPENQSANIGWATGGGTTTDILGISNVATVTEANSDFNGESNTAAIVNELGGGNYAAQKCASLKAYGFEDWYLPSAGELNLVYDQFGPAGNNNFVGGIYWTSTENNSNFAWIQNFNDGSQNISSKPNSRRCRCVRR